MMIFFEDNLKKMILKSIAFHFALILIFSIKAAFFPSNIDEYAPAIRVDLIGLPDKKNIEEPNKETKNSPKEDVAEKKETPAIDRPQKTEKITSKKDLSKDQTSALSKLKTLNAIEKLKQQTKNTPTNSTIKGNVISAGTALRGLNKIQFDEYIGSIDMHIKNNWLLPEWMLQQELKAEVLVKIDSNGLLIEKKFIKKSGHAEFDQRVLAAIEKSVPFPTPPEKFIDLVGIQGIIFAFPE